MMAMKRIFPLLLSFILGALTATLICTATMHHVVSREHAAMISELQQEKIWLGQKIASLVLEVSPDLRDSGKEILVGRDGSVEIRNASK